jgi:hypothetical protein
VSRIEERSRREYGLNHLVTLQAETFEPARNRLGSKVELEYVQIGNEVSDISIPILDTQLVLIHTSRRGFTRSPTFSTPTPRPLSISGT